MQKLEPPLREHLCGQLRAVVAAASCPAPAPGAGKEQGQMQMAVALATLAKEHLLPRTCTLLFLWRQPCDDSSA